MDEMIHPARRMPFAALHAGLIAARDAGLVSEQVDRTGLRLYCYTQSCVYDRKWDEHTLLARGLIIDPAGGRVVATPFPKFFNLGERDDTIPDLPFETYEKVDGSLIIIFWHDGEWRAATKGSFRSGQAEWAFGIVDQSDQSLLIPGTTYLAEAVYPENRIVIHYADAGLVLLAAYDEMGYEMDYAALSALAVRLDWKIAKRHAYASISDLIATARGLPATEEGFVLRFANGLRMKVKGDEYRRIHSLISRITPLAMWDALQAGDDMAAIRKDLPEEFWTDYDSIVGLINERISAIVAATEREAAAVAHLSDKDVGLRLAEFPADVRAFIFPYRKTGDLLTNQRSRQALFRAIRPTGNALGGYAPSYAIGRVLDDAA